jgi:GAF domain-containing protein
LPSKVLALDLDFQPFHSNLKNLGLVDTETSEAFNAITRLASQLFQTPVALVSIVQEELDRQYFTSQVGLVDPWATTRETPLSHSFCQHVKRTGRPLVVNDARRHDLVKENLAISVLGVIAYLGVPIIGADDTPIGALCVIESKPRIWTDKEQDLLNDLALCVRDEIKLRSHILQHKAETQAARDRQRQTVEMTQAFSAANLSADQRFNAMLHSACDLFGMTSAVLSRAYFDDFTVLYEVHEVDHARTGATKAAKQIAAQQDCIAVPDTKLWPDSPDPDLGSYLAHPLVINGVFFGVLELYAKTPKPAPWTLDELSILGMMASLACAELSVFGQIEALKRNEDALIKQIYGAAV